MSTPWDELPSDGRGRVCAPYGGRYPRNIALAYNAGHAAGLAEACEAERRAIKRAKAGERLDAWASPDHRRVFEPICSQRGYENAVLIAAEDRRAVAVAYGANGPAIKHWLAYRLGLCPRPEVGS